MATLWLQHCDIQIRNSYGPRPQIDHTWPSVAGIWSRYRNVLGPPVLAPYQMHTGIIYQARLRRRPTTRHCGPHSLERSWSPALLRLWRRQLFILCFRSERETRWRRRLIFSSVLLFVWWFFSDCRFDDLLLEANVLN